MSNTATNTNPDANKIMAVVSLVIVIAAPFIYQALPETYHGARTTFGKGLGIASLLLSLISVVYSLRRMNMRYRWGKLEIWLRVHVYTALLALLIALLHSNWRFQPGAATAALGLLFLTNISGLIGWIIYIYAPPALSRTDGEKRGSPDEIYSQMDKIQDRIETLERRIAKSGKSDDKKVSEIEAGKKELKDLSRDLKIALRREMLVGAWLYFHIPISAAFLVTAGVDGFVTFYL